MSRRLGNGTAYLATIGLLVSILATPAAAVQGNQGSPQPAAGRLAAYSFTSSQVGAIGLGPVRIAHVHVNAKWVVDGRTARTLWVDCPTSALGVVVEVTWCGTFAQGGDPAEAGANFIVRVYLGGLQISQRSGYLRTRVWGNGARTAFGGY